ncbi:MAG: hypothetical protein R2759_00930 [Bacteroidales bacterium]
MKLVKGSTFFFTLPYDTEVDTIQQIDPSDKEVNPALLEGKNILVVEDEFTNFMLIESIFQIKQCASQTCNRW